MEEWQKFSPEQKAAAMQQQEEELNAGDEDNNDGAGDDKQKNLAKNIKRGDLVTITTPQGNFDFKMEKRHTKKVAYYKDMYGRDKQLEIFEEEIPCQ